MMTRIPSLVKYSAYEVTPVASKVLTPERERREGSEEDVDSKRMTPATMRDANESKSQRRHAAAPRAEV